jgi:tetratricopeptide (TPR) repeat protein
MLPWIFSLLIWLTDNGSFRKIEARNIAKIEAQRAIKQAQYTEAAKQFEQVNQQTMLKDPAVLFDLGQAYFVTKKYEKATEVFLQTAKTRNTALSSKALTQLGNIAILKGDSAKALDYFKNALVLDTDNAVARIDYEIVRKNYTPRLAKNQNSPETSQKQQNTPQETPQNMENDEENKQKEVMKKLKNYNLTQESAMLILESIKNSERQYVQQRSAKTSSKKTKQEDWW